MLAFFGMEHFHGQRVRDGTPIGVVQLRPVPKEKGFVLVEPDLNQAVEFVERQPLHVSDEPTYEV